MIPFFKSKCFPLAEKFRLPKARDFSLRNHSACRKYVISCRGIILFIESKQFLVAELFRLSKVSDFPLRNHSVC